LLIYPTGGGVIVPALSHTHDSGSGIVKKPVRYGTRIRNKQKKEGHQDNKGKEDEPGVDTSGKQLEEEEQETETLTEGATGLHLLILASCCYGASVSGGDTASEDKVPDSWDREDANSEEVHIHVISLSTVVLNSRD